MKTKEHLTKEINKIFTRNQNKSYQTDDFNNILHLKDEEKIILPESISELLQTHHIEQLEDGSFKFDGSDTVIEGTFKSNERGFGFINADEEELFDYYVAPNNTGNALDLDKVKFKVIHKVMPGDEKGPEAKVIDVLERQLESIVGQYFAFSEQEKSETGFIGTIKSNDKKLQNYEILVSDKGLTPASGQIVKLSIREYPNSKHSQTISGFITADLGAKDQPGVDLLQILAKHDVLTEFPEEVLKEADNLPSEVLPQDEIDRIDITDIPTVTIDGDDSKDFDDAVSVKKLDNGNYLLGVHIADVSHYVTSDSELDKQAFERGTSTYLTNKVVPMLPFKISNGIASLNPGVKRLSMTCDMEINPQGEVVDYKIYESIIKSHGRLTYNNVNALFSGDDSSFDEEHRYLIPMLQDMRDLHNILYNTRHKRGAIDFEDSEAQIIVDDNGKAIDIVLRERGDAEKMIESMMLSANETVAKHFYLNNYPFLYRIHETPDDEKVDKFFKFTDALGIKALAGRRNKIKPKLFQEVLSQVADSPQEKVVTIMLLRSMQQAKYSDQMLGHFGLAAEYYTHFTSPIRRYPDLIVHRMIKEYTKNANSEEIKHKWQSILPEIGKQTSALERKSVDAERDTIDLKKAEFMADKVGQEFDATISSVLGFGMFVELPNTVEGLVHISNLKDDFYTYNEDQMTLVGKNSHTTFKIGQPVKVKLINVNIDQHLVDFELVKNNEEKVTSI